MVSLARGHGTTVLLAAYKAVISSVTFTELDLVGRIWTRLHVFWATVGSRVDKPKLAGYRSCVVPWQEATSNTDDLCELHSARLSIRTEAARRFDRRRVRHVNAVGQLQ